MPRISVRSALVIALSASALACIVHVVANEIGWTVAVPLTLLGWFGSYRLGGWLYDIDHPVE